MRAVRQPSPHLEPTRPWSFRSPFWLKTYTATKLLPPATLRCFRLVPNGGCAGRETSAANLSLEPQFAILQWNCVLLHDHSWTATATWCHPDAGLLGTLTVWICGAEPPRTAYL